MVESGPSGRLLIGGSPRAGTAISCGTAQRVNSFGLADTPSHNADARWALEWRNPTRAISAMLWPSVTAIRARPHEQDRGSHREVLNGC